MAVHLFSGGVDARALAYLVARRARQFPALEERPTGAVIEAVVGGRIVRLHLCRPAGGRMPRARIARTELAQLIGNAECDLAALPAYVGPPEIKLVKLCLRGQILGMRPLHDLLALIREMRRVQGWLNTQGEALYYVEWPPGTVLDISRRYRRTPPCSAIPVPPSELGA